MENTKKLCSLDGKICKPKGRLHISCIPIYGSGLRASIPVEKKFQYTADNVCQDCGDTQNIGTMVVPEGTKITLQDFEKDLIKS
ncbi:MAG: hypothetical protein FWE45_03165 [Firmicutes bacterium]|nr:hypothetical protein [Bacillota bacterium]